MSRQRLLDLFCGAGGAAMGYYRAGFDVTGVDTKPQPHYPFEFHHADALEYCAAHGREFDVIHASPPCQAYSRTRTLPNVSAHHPDLVSVTRQLLIAIGRPYIIENVPGSPLINPLMLCGTMFGLGVLRHRLFESDPPIWFPPATCAHDGKAFPMFWKSLREIEESPMRHMYKFITVAGRSFRLSQAAPAMKIDWMTVREIAQAIPPAYTTWIGEQFLSRELSTTGGEHARM